MKDFFDNYDFVENFETLTKKAEDLQYKLIEAKDDEYQILKQELEEILYRLEGDLQ